MKISRIARAAIAPLLSVIALASSGCGGDDSEPIEATLLVDNRSDFEVDELYLTEVDSGSWGTNLLGDPLRPGETVLLYDIECDLYDALLIDEEGVECELLDIDLCFSDSTWIIRNRTCTIFTADQLDSTVEAPRARGPRPGE